MQKGKGKGLSYGSCWTCGGSLFSRECPKGDGGGGGMKGGGKNNWKAIKCFDCRGVVHRAAHCPTSVPEVEYEEEDGGHGDVESVSEGWDIFGLEEGMRRQATIGGSSRGGTRVYVLGFQPSRSAIPWELRKRPPDASGSGVLGRE